MQITRYKGVISRYKSVEVGIPQGLVLEPLLFAIYINNMTCATGGYLFLVDDTVVSVSDTNIDSLVRKLNYELKIFFKWSRNKLKLNTCETKAIVIYSSTIANVSENVVIDGMYINEINHIPR